MRQTDILFLFNQEFDKLFSDFESKVRASETLSIMVALCMATKKLCADFPTVRAGVGVYKAMREKRRAVFTINGF